MARVAASIVLLLLAVAGCDKASVQQCDKGCRNYFTLHYWDDANKEIAAAPEADRARLRAEKEAALEPRLLQNIDLCVQKCRSGATEGRVQCWIDAKTSAEAEACASE